jgi:hypothetical protein
MKIDRSNYEIWFTDWADNNLNQSQVEELYLFLEQNPDLFKEFEALTEMKLVNTDLSFKSKNRLKRSASELSTDQFEYLCAAYFENDLADDQKAEILELKESDREKARIFDMMSRTRLRAPSLEYAGKKALLRKTPFEKAVRFSLISLGAAAAIASFLIVYPISRNTSIITDQPSYAENSKDTLQINLSPKITKPVEKITQAVPETVAENVNPTAENIKAEETIKASTSGITEEKGVQKVEMKDFRGAIAFNDSELRNSLIESDLSFKAPVEDDGRSNIGKFIARNFREKILRQKQVTDAPLKGYELAEAGIEGLNKLLGWQMALDTNTDENGDVESVRFNSKMLKFSAPVKKSESGE